MKKILAILLLCLIVNLAGRGIAETYSSGFIFGSMYMTIVYFLPNKK